MRLAERSLREDPKEVRDISTVTVAVRFSDLEEIRTRIRELRQSIMHMMADSGDPDCVYQLNFQVFPLSRVDGRGMPNAWFGPPTTSSPTSAPISGGASAAATTSTGMLSCSPSAIAWAIVRASPKTDS